MRDTAEQTAQKPPSFAHGVVVTFLAGFTALLVILASGYGIGWHWLAVAVIVFFIYTDLKKNNVPIGWYAALVFVWIWILYDFSDPLVEWFRRE